MVTKNKNKVYSIGSGKSAAISINQYLSGKPVVGREKLFNSRIGKMNHEEIDTTMESVINRENRYKPSSGQGTIFSNAEQAGFTRQEAQAEASRCLHCDCRAKDNCDLRDQSEFYSANQRHYAGARRPYTPLQQDPQLHLDAGKCLQCGLCVQISHDGGEEIGLAYRGRGFSTEIVVPFGKTMSEALAKTAQACADACPTGAIEFKEEPATVKNPYDRELV